MGLLEYINIVKVLKKNGDDYDDNYCSWQVFYSLILYPGNNSIYFQPQLVMKSPFLLTRFGSLLESSLLSQILAYCSFPVLSHFVYTLPPKKVKNCLEKYENYLTDNKDLRKKALGAA